MDSAKLVPLVALAAACAIFFFVVKNRQRYFLFLMVLFAPQAPAIIIRHYNGVYLMDIPLAILLVYGIFSSRRFRLYAGVPVLGFIFWCLFSGLLATRTDMAMIELTRTLRAYLAFLCVINFTRSKNDVYAVLFALLAGLLFQGTLGFLQWRRGYLGLSFLWEPQFWWRSRGTFIHPNFLADYLILVLPIVLRLFVFYKAEKRLYNAALGAIFLIGVGALFGSYARGAWLGFTGAMIIMMLYSLFRRRYHPKLVSGIAVLVLLATVFSVHYSDKILAQFGEQSGRTSAMKIRFPLNKISLRIIKDNLIFGVGLDNYEQISYKYVYEEDTSDMFPYEHLLQVVHNSYLLILAETGMPGFLFFLSFLVFLFNRGRRILKIKNSLVSNIGLGILTGFLAFMATLLTGPDYYAHQIMMMFWILGGFLVVLSRIKTLSPKKLPEKSEAQKPQVVGNSKGMVENHEKVLKNING